MKNNKVYNMYNPQAYQVKPMCCCNCCCCHRHKILPPYVGLPTPPTSNYNVRIKSMYTGEFVRVGEYRYLYATDQGINTGDRFQLIMNGNYVKIKEYNRDFVRINEENSLVADASEFRAAVFGLYRIDQNNSYVFRAPNGKFVGVADKTLILVAASNQGDPRAVFKFKTY